MDSLNLFDTKIQLDSKRENMGKSNMFNENIINKGLESLSDSD